jgi:molybdopterin-guanine dinucleotide biosynthesis protein A
VAAARLANIKGFMAYAPAGSADFFHGILPDGVDLIETAATDLGGCLLQAATTLLDAGHASVCLLSSDNPTLPAGYVATAASLLAAAGDRAVIGPSTDGGYYLIGIKRAHRRLFDDIAWSSEHVLRQTLARADELGLPIAMLPAWYDVDDLDTLRVLIGELLDDAPFRAAAKDAAPAHFTRRSVRVLRETCAALAAGTDSHAGQR